MTELHVPEPDRPVPELQVTLDMAEFDAIRMHLDKASELVHNITERHALRMSGVEMAAEAAVLADLRIARRDTEDYVRRLSREG